MRNPKEKPDPEIEEKAVADTKEPQLSDYELIVVIMVPKRSENDG